ncbi:hypothetical protein [Aeromonas dhakensis]|uniref:hypothetical protein n=1 Tax=Aeromonas dhakensis TaxID=196024 RepID=UPI00244B276A|nr:hypothetical protein [Aeromonas dhakensis]MDH0348193.1 hypothetical protein [Aeromonas dhakensis]
MSQDAPHNPYQLGDPATAIGRVRPFPASMLVHLVRSLISKTTSAVTVLVIAESPALADLVRALGSSGKFNIRSPKLGGQIAESVGLSYPCQVILVDGVDHPLLAAASSRAAPRDTGTVIVTKYPMASACALAQIEQQRAAVRYQLDPAL